MEATPAHPMRVALLAASVALGGATAGAADSLPMIDTHAHFARIGAAQVFAGGGQRNAPGHASFASNAPSFGAAAETAVAAMDRLGIRLTLVMPPPQAPGAPNIYDCDALGAALGREAARFRLLGGGGRLNAMIQSTAPDQVTDRVKQRFRETAIELAADCHIVGFGEVTAHHLSLAPMGAQHPYERVPPDHPLLLLLADIAAEMNLPIDLHLDLVPHDMPMPARPLFNVSNPRELPANLPGFERLLAHNPKARIIWAHAGSDPLQTRTPELQRRLLARYPNLYMSLRPGRGGPMPALMLDPRGRIKPDWLALLQAFPDRFVLGSDQFHAPAAGHGRVPAVTIDNFPNVIGQLPAPLARAIAYENAERLYGIELKP